MLQDVIALVIQSIGGASASSANTHVEAQKGANIALGEYIFRLPATDCLSHITGGIIFQFASVVVYMFLTSEFVIRFLLKKPFHRREDTLNGGRVVVLDSKAKQMLYGVGLSTLAMFIRYAPATCLPSV